MHVWKVKKSDVIKSKRDEKDRGGVGGGNTDLSHVFYTSALEYILHNSNNSLYILRECLANRVSLLLINKCRLVTLTLSSPVPRLFFVLLQSDCFIRMTSRTALIATSEG